MDNKVYEIVTEQIIERLEGGVVPWHKPWNGEEFEPKNLKSKKPYRGINLFILACAGYGSPYWVSFKQCNELGGKVKPGQKGTIIIFWKPVLYKNKDAEGNETDKKVFLLRYYRVWNVEQCEGLKLPVPEAKEGKQFIPVEEAERILNSYKDMVTVYYSGNRAYYSEERDIIGMPPKDTFEGEDEFYSTMFHEVVHSTGHNSRLDRLEKGWFGSEPYSKEELVAEMGAAFLCSMTGIKTTITNSASYIASWLKRLREDKKLVVCAAAKAQRACDYILGKTHGEEKCNEEEAPKD